MTNNLFQAYLNGDIAKAGIKDWTQFSNDDVIEALNNNYIQAFIPEIIQTHDIPENVYISFIKKNPTTKYKMAKTINCGCAEYSSYEHERKPFPKELYQKCLNYLKSI